MCFHHRNTAGGFGSRGRGGGGFRGGRDGGGRGGLPPFSKNPSSNCCLEGAYLQGLKLRASSYWFWYPKAVI
ncbi:hypothetical protein HanRHA438_Chr10g0467621 [Helianthus annuus]|nr:hypothetical protein HanRHA438_Chr10g0467621 [Helianthus annuus]